MLISNSAASLIFRFNYCVLVDYLLIWPFHFILLLQVGVVPVNEAVQIAEDNDLILVPHLPQMFLLIHFLQKHTFQHKAVQIGIPSLNNRGTLW